jgi:ATP-dependent RNA helicase DeaD
VAYVVSRSHKPAALGRVLDVESPTAALVFCRTRTEVDALTETLNGRGYRAEALHGGMGQEQRERVLGRLRAGTAELLIATDVAARGLDIDVLTHVVNYDVPSAPESYVHRIGRVGRAGREGVAITLADPREHRLLKNIERLTGQRVEVSKVPSVADLHARRLQLTVGTLRDRIERGDLDRYRPVIEALAEDFDVLEVALGAVALAAEAAGPAGDEVEIPEPRPRRERPERDRPGRDRGDGDGRGRPFRDREGRERPRGEGGGDGRSPGGPRRRGSGGATTRLFVGVGRNVGIRPQDLVGAITGETSLSGRDIGAIEISDRFSLVEVPADAADDVVTSLRSATIKGRRANVRRERFERDG